MHKYEQEDIAKIVTLPYSWDKLENSTILLSGGTGLIGSFFCEVIKYRNKQFNSNIKVISLSRNGGSSSEGINNIKADVTKEIKVEGNIDYVVHLASNTHPKDYEEDPIGTIMTNVSGCDNLLKVAIEKKAKKFILASSVEVYGSGIDHPIKEDEFGYISLEKYRSGYNEAKRLSEVLCQSYKKKYGLNISIARFARVFGNNKRPDTKALSQFIEKAVNKEDVVLNSAGNQKYSFVYVADAVSALIKIIIDGENGEAYNVSDDSENKTLKDYASFLSDLANTKITIQLKNNESVSSAVNALLDTTKIKLIGWKPVYSVSEALKRLYIIKTESK